MSVGIFQNGEYNKVAGNAKDSTAANTTYNNGTSGLQANNVQSAIDEVSAKIGQENISQVGNSVTGAINNLNSKFEINEVINNDILFTRTGNIVTMSSQGNWTLYGTVTIPEGFRPKNKTIIIVKNTTNDNTSFVWLNALADQYSNNNYVYVYGTWIAE